MPHLTFLLLEFVICIQKIKNCEWGINFKYC
ncbi:hypothetical protein GLYMA_06G171850v4 [Glycine max]|nr:hypothetical protein GLYMA_06G171850v4 [Glycine max]KAH1126370.1 hypothetical protein GYH30_015387 [Glycine max]